MDRLFKFFLGLFLVLALWVGSFELSFSGDRVLSGLGGSMLLVAMVVTGIGIDWAIYKIVAMFVSDKVAAVFVSLIVASLLLAGYIYMYVTDFSFKSTIGLLILIDLISAVVALGVAVAVVDRKSKV